MCFVGSQWIQDRHLWIWIYPWISTQNLWIWIWIWMGYFHIHGNRGKGSVGVSVSRDCPLFRVPPVIPGTGKATKFKFCRHIYRLNRNKSPLNISGKVAVGVVMDSRKFSGHPYILRIARSSLRWLSFLVYHAMLHRMRLCHSVSSACRSVSPSKIRVE